ncbi:MAG: ABC transporter permease [Deltaproteobacteria bacterium]|nr:MAG: ABC transporter permease [Deltaproteobacteria bacterium]
MTEAPSFPRFSEPTVIIEPHKSLLHLDLKAIWEYRELLFFLVWRDLKVRYRQTIIGIGWVVLQPLMTMALFTAVFGNFAKIPSDGVPYPIFTYSALLPWNLFATSLTRGTESVVGNAQLISKIYFPRLLLPISGILSPTVDFAISFVILAVMMIWFRTLPTWGVLALPFFLILALLTALAVGLWLSALNVRYRDVGHTIPFLVQLWMFASPVAYPVSLVPERWRVLYSLNPMAGVIEGFRWALLGKESPDFEVIVISSMMVTTLLISGVVFFKHTERTFADVI